MTPHQRAFLKLMDELVRNEGFRSYEAFSAFLELAFRAMAGVTLTGEAKAKNEAAYMDQVHRFQRQKGSAGICARALGEVIEGLEAGDGDFLGPIFMETAANPRSGQFFTPWTLCQTMAQMTIGPEVCEIAKERVITISEPASGCGGMVLAASDRLKELGINPATRAHFTLVDVDMRCVQAAFIQTSLAGMSATVIHGDTLKLEQWSAWQTLMAVAFPKLGQSVVKLPDGAEPAIAAPVQHAPASAVRAPLQLAFADL